MRVHMLTQVFPPDSAAVGQYFEEAALEIAKQGHEVVVWTADRDYDNPKIRYDNRSRHPGITLKRLPFSSFGKKTILHRLLGQASFLGQSFFRLLMTRRIDRLIVTTIPATTGVMLAWLSFFRRLRTVYWVMDINPDQAVALGLVKPQSLSRKFLDAVNQRLLNRAEKIVTLDRYMAKRLTAKTPNPEKVQQKLSIIPPWPLDGVSPKTIETSAKNPFRQEHRISSEDFVFMYAGNHSLVHPLDGLLAAIRQKNQWPQTLFAFIGGGGGKEAVEALAQHREGRNLLSLPYQPLEKVPAMLAAGDVQIVAMGAAMVGIVHPCKIYTAMALAKPILFYGPKKSPLGDLVEKHRLGWVIPPEFSPPEIANILTSIRTTPPEELHAMGKRCREIIQHQFNPQTLRSQFVAGVTL